MLLWEAACYETMDHCVRLLCKSLFVWHGSVAMQTLVQKAVFPGMRSAVARVCMRVPASKGGKILRKQRQT